LFGPAAGPAIPALIQVLAGPALELPGHFTGVRLANSRRTAARALAEIGPDARPAVPALIALLQARADFNAACYCHALGRIGPDAKAALPALEDATQSDNRGIRLAAATALTMVVPEHSSNAVKVLRSLQNDPELATVWASNGDGVVSPTSRKDFQSSGCRFFTLAADVPLWRLGLEKVCPAAAIVAEINKPQAADNISYIELLGDIGPDARAALSVLEKSVDKYHSGFFGRDAAIAIRRIDPDTAEKLGLPGMLALP
jgi:hypothetical protein